MNKKIWFVSRSYPPSPGGGAFVRKQQVMHLRESGHNVTVIMPPQTSQASQTTQKFKDEQVKDNTGEHFKVISPKLPLRVGLYLERLLLIPDYMYFWGRQVTDFLINNAEEKSVVVITTGGELGVFSHVKRIKKKRPDIKIVLSYHDLIAYAKYDGASTFSHPHQRIDKYEGEAIEFADNVLAQSEIMQEMLCEKYPQHKGKIDFIYFGFQSDTPLLKKKQILDVDKITIAYAGNMGKLQSPEILIRAYRVLPTEVKNKIHLMFIGDFSNNEVISEANDVEKVGYLQRNEMLELLEGRVDIALVSAINIKTLRPLMPTKLYEYIGLGVPLLCIVPKDCEVERVVNKYKIGESVTYGDEADVVKVLSSMVLNMNKINEMKKNILDIRSEFSSENTLEKMRIVIDL